MSTRHFFLLLALFLVPIVASAQDVATIVGTVTDSTGAVVPNAKITVSNAAKGFTRDCVSNTDGEYTAPLIPIGDYTVTAEVAGFEKLTRTGFTVTAGQTLRVDLRLEVGSSQQQVTVLGNVPKVDTETGAVSTVITSTQISELNIPARNFTDLAMLVPGAAPGSTFTPFTPSGVIGDQYIAINGMPGTGLAWDIDGVSTVDPSSGSDSLQVFPSLEMLAEFRISTSNYSAATSRTGSSTIEMVTKSGTSQFHGSAFEFVRNSILNANDWFLNRASEPVAPARHNDFGFTLGGPLYIPGVYNTHKDRTFFFLSEEWRFDRTGTIINTTVPSALERSGNFSQCDPSSSNYNAVVASGCVLPTDLTTGTTYANDTVPVSPIATTLLNAYVPLPNVQPIGYIKAFTIPFNWREDSLRVDHNISTNLRIFGRVTQDRENDTAIPAYYGNTYPTTEDKEHAPARNEVLNLTYTIRPNLVNALIFAYQSQNDNVDPLVTGIDSVSRSVLYPSSGLQIGNIFPASASGIAPIGKLLPGISVGGGGPGFAQNPGEVLLFWDSSPTLRDDAVWMRGKHTLRFGGYLRRVRLNNSVFEGDEPEGALTFLNAGANTTGNGMADFFLGNLYSFGQGGGVLNGQLVGGAPEGHYRGWDFEPYLQDDWRATRRLTLNLGFRYYYVTPFADVTKPPDSSIFMPSQYNLANEATYENGGLVSGTGDTWLNYGNGLDECGVGSIPLGCIAVTHKTPSPRFGFAWDPRGSGKTSIRGGYGLMFDSGNAHMLSSGRNGNVPRWAYLTTYYVNNWGYPTVAAPGILPVASTYSQPLYQHLPEFQQFNLTVEHEFPGNNLVSVAYVGNLGRHLSRGRNVNQVLDGITTVNVPSLAGTPYCDASGNCDVQDALINDDDPAYAFAPFRGYSVINQSEASGISNYNSLQINYRHPIGHGMTFQAVYTWAHELDDLLGAGGSENVYATTDDDYHLSRWYGNSADNQAQVLTLNYVYRIPFFAHSTNRFLRGALSGWQFGGISTFETGNPIGVSCGLAGMSSAVGGGVTCNSLGKVQIQKGTVDDPVYGPTPTWLNPGTIEQITVPQLYSNNEPGMFGYMGKFALTGPGRSDWDLSLIRNLQLPWFHSEHSTLQFRWETFNTFNHPQWSGVNLFCSNVTPAGQPCNGANNIGNGEVTSDYEPRTMQLGMRLVF